MRVLLEAAAGSGADVLDYKKKTETKRLPAVTRIRRNSCFCELRRAVRDTSIVPANSTAVSFDDTGTTLVVLIWSVVCVVLSPTFFVLPQMFAYAAVSQRRSLSNNLFSGCSSFFCDKKQEKQEIVPDFRNLTEEKAKYLGCLRIPMLGAGERKKSGTKKKKNRDKKKGKLWKFRTKSHSP